MTDYSEYSIEQLKAELETWQGVNKWITKAVQRELRNRVQEDKPKEKVVTKSKLSNSKKKSSKKKSKK